MMSVCVCPCVSGGSGQQLSFGSWSAAPVTAPVLLSAPLAQPAAAHSGKSVTYAQPIVTYAQPVIQKFDMAAPKLTKQHLNAEPIVQPVSDTNTSDRGED